MCTVAPNRVWVLASVRSVVKTWVHLHLAPKLDLHAAVDAFSHGKLVSIALQSFKDEPLVLTGTAGSTQGTTMVPG